MMVKKGIPYEKSFASHEKSKYWHNEKNGDIKPEDVTIRTGTKYWFVCNNPECMHEFLTSPDKIACGNWCFYCSILSRTLCDDTNCNKCFEKSFASHEKSKYWSDKNEFKPNKVMKYSNKKFWFNCSNCNHSFESVLGSITQGSWCPYCSPSPKQLCNNENCNMCFENSFASHEKAKYWNNELNNNIKPRNVFKANNKKYYFTCNECKHNFDIALNNLSTNNRWCPYCGINKLCDDNNCKTCFDKSFASHSKSSLWSIKNGYITPRQVSKCNGKKYWFTCKDCTHNFEMAINHIVRFDIEKNCPICSSQYLCDDNECKICFDKSFASSPFIDKLNKEKNNGINLRNVFKSGGQTLFFDCECGHIVETKPCYIDNKIPCAYCHSLKLCDNNDCKKCFDNSFASNPFNKFLIDKDINPRMIVKGSKQKYNFKCNKGHTFIKQISLITMNSLGCPTCINKTEQILYEKISKIYKNIIFQYRPEWCKNENTLCYLPFDFALEEHKIIIELDGKQHFKQVKNWVSPEETQNRDKYKMKKANENGFSVIRILQTDVLYDRYDWINEMDSNIKKIINENIVKNIYMCKKNEYDVYINS